MAHEHPPAEPTRAMTRLGLIASALCAVHCALVGIMAAVFPAAGSGLLDERLELALIGGAAVVALWVLVPAFGRHRDARPLVLLGLAVGAFVLARLFGVEGSRAEQAGGILGAGLLLGAQLLNSRADRRCRGCAPHEVAR